MMATPRFGSWVAIVPASTRLAVDCGALAGSWAPGSTAATPNKCAETTLETSIPACGARGAALVTTGWGDFTGPPLSSEKTIRANSTAISTAKAIETSRGPLPGNRASHPCVRASSIWRG